VSNGERLKKELQNFPMAEEFLSSRITVFCRNDTKILAVCGIRSIFNILAIHVAEGYRGKGLGTHVLRKTIEIARRRNLNFITLPVLVDNVRALRLYFKFSFKEVIRLENYLTLMLPLTLVGEIFYLSLRVVCSVLPVVVLTHAVRSIFQKTLNS